MTRDPYRIAGPAVISFSGGRTSGYVLKHILDGHGGALPSDVRVVFANTGKESAPRRSTSWPNAARAGAFTSRGSNMIGGTSKNSRFDRG